MSLTLMVAEFLKITPAQAKSIITLVSVENRWNETQSYKDANINPAEINTQADLILFLQAIGQTKWFKGHDRSKFTENTSDEVIKALYADCFEQLGLFTEVPYEGSAPQFGVVLGSSEGHVKTRTDYLINMIRQGIAPTENIIFGLGSNRALGTGVTKGSEDESIARLSALGAPLTEMAMVNLIVTEAIEALKLEDPRFASLIYQPIDTIGAASRADTACVKTGDTAASLRDFIEANALLDNYSVINVATSSTQPYVIRQGRDVQAKLGDRYNVISIGQGYTRAQFIANPSSINVCLGEVARLINIAYSSPFLSNDLTADQKRELLDLRTLNTRNASNPLRIFNSSQESDVLTNAKPTAPTGVAGAV